PDAASWTACVLTVQGDGYNWITPSPRSVGSVSGGKSLREADLSPPTCREAASVYNARMTKRLAAITCLAFLGLTSTQAQQPTGRQFQLVGDGKAYRLEMKTVARPTPGAKQILVRVRAVSLNQRDLLVTRAQYGGTGGGAMVGKVPLSDGAGEVV